MRVRLGTIVALVVWMLSAALPAQAGEPLLHAVELHATNGHDQGNVFHEDLGSWTGSLSKPGGMLITVTTGLSDTVTASSLDSSAHLLLVVEKLNTSNPRSPWLHVTGRGFMTRMLKSAGAGTLYHSVPVTVTLPVTGLAPGTYRVRLTSSFVAEAEWSESGTMAIQIIRDA
jgi:hypothetical protein